VKELLKRIIIVLILIFITTVFMAAVLPLYAMIRDVPNIDYEKIIEIINNEYFEYIEDSLRRIHELIINNF